MSTIRNKSVIPQHEVLRTPTGWNGEERGLIVQLERVHDDIYKHFRKLTIDDFSPELIEALREKLNEE